jgi:hypothetical protein
MRKSPEAPRYMVYVGEREQIESGQWIGVYAVRGFDGQDSRFQQVLDVVDELAVDADTLDMRPIFPKEQAHLDRFAGRPRIPLSNGLVAEVIARQTEGGNWESTYNAKPAPPRPTGDQAQPFPWINSVVG